MSRWSNFDRIDLPADYAPNPTPTPEPESTSDDQAPSGLSAALADGGGVALSWTAPAEDTGSVTGYEVLRAAGDAGFSTLAADTASTATAYTDATATEAGETYAYKVKAIRGEDRSQASGQAEVQLPHGPVDLAPTVLTAVVLTAVVLTASLVVEEDSTATVPISVSLRWSAPAEDADSVTGYEVLRAVGDGEIATLVADTGSTATAYTDTTATEAGETYAYKVKAIRGEDRSQASGQAQVQLPHDAVDLAPSSLTAAAVDGGGVDLSWSAPAEDAESVTGYEVLRAVGEGDTGHAGCRHRVHRHDLYRRHGHRGGRDLRLPSQGHPGRVPEPVLGRSLGRTARGHHRLDMRVRFRGQRSVRGRQARLARWRLAVRCEVRRARPAMSTGTGSACSPTRPISSTCAASRPASGNWSTARRRSSRWAPWKIPSCWASTTRAAPWSRAATRSWRGTGKDSRIASFTPDADGVYFISASAESGWTGTYELSLTVTAGEHDPTSLAPGGLTVGMVRNRLNLSWTAPAADADSVTGYEILRGREQAALATLVADTASTSTTYRDETATQAGVTYTYAVKALRGDVASGESPRASYTLPSGYTASTKELASKGYEHYQVVVETLEFAPQIVVQPDQDRQTIWTGDLNPGLQRVLFRYWHVSQRLVGSQYIHFSTVPLTKLPSLALWRGTPTSPAPIITRKT